MPYLSDSQISTAECMARWGYHYVAREPGVINDNALPGDMFHKGAELDGLAALHGEPRLTRPQLIDAAYDALMERVAKEDAAGLVTWDLVREFLGRAGAIIDTYLTDLQPHYQPIAAPEDGFTFGIEGAPGWQFTGKRDARFMWHGEPTILDLKSAGKPWWPGTEHKKSQATAYTLADQIEARPDAARRVVFAVFSTRIVGGDWRADLACLPTHRGPAQWDNYKRLMALTAHKLDAARVSGDFKPTPSALCGYCAYWHLCKTGRDYLEAEGRMPPRLRLPVVEKGGAL